MAVLIVATEEEVLRKNVLKLGSEGGRGGRRVQVVEEKKGKASAAIFQFNAFG